MGTKNIIKYKKVSVLGLGYVGLPTAAIIANKGTLTGSIGVIMNYPILNDLLDDYGVDYKTIKSGPYKDSGSAFRHSTIIDSLYFQEVVDNMYEQFTSALKYERGLSDATIQM